MHIACKGKYNAVSFVPLSLLFIYCFFSIILRRDLQEVMLHGLQDAEGRQRVNRVTVFERPGLHEFLQRTSEFADLVLFTAGLEGLIFSTICIF